MEDYSIQTTISKLDRQAYDYHEKLKRSDNSKEYWSDLQTLHDLRSQVATLEMTQYLDENRTRDEHDEHVVRFEHVIQTHKKLKLLCEEHDARVSETSWPKRQVMFACSRLGLNAPNAEIATAQRRTWRKEILRDYDLLPEAREDRALGLVWNVAEGAMASASDMRAVQIFPSSWGQPLMTELFGEICSRDLWSSRNGLVLPAGLARAMEDYAVVLVPDGSVHKELKFRVLDPDHPALSRPVLSTSSGSGSGSGDIGNTRLFRDLDQSRLTFRGRLRPCARFLWLSFACAMLKRLWMSPKKPVSQEFAGVWSLPQPFVKKPYVLGIVEEVGSEVAESCNLSEAAMVALEREDEVSVKVVPILFAGRLLELCRRRYDEDGDGNGDGDEGIVVDEDDEETSMGHEDIQGNRRKPPL